MDNPDQFVGSTHDVVQLILAGYLQFALDTIKKDLRLTNAFPEEGLEVFLGD